MRRVICGVVAAVVIGGLFGVGVAAAQQAERVTFESGQVVNVVGNNLWVRGVHQGKQGIHHFVVPDDFRFTVDGRQVSVRELRKGMRLDATIIEHYPAESRMQVAENEVERHVAEVQSKPAPRPSTAPRPAPAQRSATTASAPVMPASLPATAGPLPLLALIGIGALAAGAGVSVVRRRR